ncbi:hypothetical protein E8L90_21550 [Brevibacillus antibioticus]|uniref:Fibronectin type III domain-containing protein n=1 Tax=Brevibacillus antibioticus TaxID=2570228 RepID=A0A4U2YAP4_9BACL|nr:MULTISPECIES: hypothetical protein [Brevibacillus]TKI57806.1 hypothetical protein E8L90_21550 [Brevibacillus antibioticus]
MKKFITGLATLAVLTSAVPAFAQEPQQALATTSTTNYSTPSKESKASVAEYVNLTVRWNNVSNAVRYEYILTNVTDGYPYESGSMTATVANITALRVGKLFSFYVRAVDKYGNTIGQAVLDIVPTGSNIDKNVWIS